MKKKQFHSLDALRFFAFFKVYLLHIPLQGSFPVFGYLKSGGGIGVAFFFVLSGFLISYLLVFEKINKRSINLKRFLIRRSFRIWPLFYLLVLLALLLPYDFKEQIGMHMVGGGYAFDWRYSFTFLENYKMLIVDNSPKTTPLPVFWSLCVEEHFYIFWLISLFFIPVKHLPKFFITCFFIAWAARFSEPFIWNNSRIDTVDLFTNLDYFAGGGILGYWVAKEYDKMLAFIDSIPKWGQYATVFSVIGMVVFQKELLPYDTKSWFFIFRSSIISLSFTVLIMLFIPKDSSIKINSRVLNYLGSISYGLYVYHIFFVHVVFQYCLNQDIKIDDWGTLSLYILVTLGGTIIVSMLSYHFYEKPFLKLRERLAA